MKASRNLFSVHYVFSYVLIAAAMVALTAIYAGRQASDQGILDASVQLDPAQERLAEPLNADEQIAERQRMLLKKFLMERRSPVRPAIYIEPATPDSALLVRWDI